MNKLSPSSITIEEAVARMINFEEILPGKSLLEMTEWLVADAENDYEGAKEDRLPDDQIDKLKFSFKACEARHFLASNLFAHIEWELQSSEPSILKCSSETSSVIRLEVESVARWARDHYAIGRFDYEELNYNTDTEKPPKASPNVEIIYDKEALSPIKANSLYTTFAFLLEAFVSANDKVVKYGTKDKLSVYNIAEHLKKLALAVNKSPNNGQGLESIKTRIEEAMDRKRKFIEGK